MHVLSEKARNRNYWEVYSTEAAVGQREEKQKEKGEGSDGGSGVGRDGGENSSRKRRYERATGIADVLQM